ncbi:MAG: sulfatase-like hydrolase/transferase [Verrucomicrobia bacterium]|nr:sulfatase-like hydrolase/transferase [Verrucomicrobiota bacterium]
MYRNPLILATIFATVAPLARADGEPKPNILLIVGDDMGYGDVGFHGCKDIPTPNLDALASGGVRFTNGYVSAPYCSPTRAGLLTGRCQTRFGHEFNPSGPKCGLPLTEQTIADRLKGAGYATGIVGKWHLGANPDFHPLKRGFGEFYGFLGGAHDYFKSNGIQRGTTPLTDTAYTTDDFAREAAAFVERHREKPWFLYLAFNAVHTPMQATKEKLERFPNIQDRQRRTYAAMMSAMDDAIGTVRKRIAESGQESRTLVMFISDNGGPVMQGTTINASCNAPLRGSKRTTLEGGIRVPFVISWPGRLKPAIYQQPAIQLDLTATALAAAGVPAKPESKPDGVDLLPYLNGEKSGPPHESLCWRFGPQMAVRVGDFKLVRYDPNADSPTTGKARKATPPRLYNLREDLGESKDLSATMPEKVNELQAVWDAWNTQNTPPLWAAENKGSVLAR